MRSLISLPAAKTVLTVAYLFSALVITVATSKSPDGTKNSIALGVTNYSAYSTCRGAIERIAFRSNSGTIEKSVYLNGQATHRPINYKALGFPNPTVLVGLDQIGSGTDSTCKVVEKKSVLNNGFDENVKNQAFYSLGQLTTFTYACTNSQGANCKVVLSELPSGPIEDVYF